MKILLVDDSKSARYALRLQLQRHGAVVETADSAEVALERIVANPPDAVFMDHTMPGMNGVEALEILKSAPDTASIPVVICTANEDAVFVDQARSKGAFEILSKAAAPEKLGDLLQRMDGAIAVSTSSIDKPSGTASPASGKEALAGPPNVIEPTADISAEASLDERFGDQLGVQQQLSEINQAALRAIETQLAKERQETARMVQELIDANLEGLADDPAFLRRVLENTETTVTQTAETIVRRQSQEIAESIAAQLTSEVADSIGNSVRESLPNVYLLSTVAAAIGVAAAAIVYLLEGS
jgi:CheY-like chemotaxis protein